MPCPGVGNGCDVSLAVREACIVHKYIGHTIILRGTAEKPLSHYSKHPFSPTTVLSYSARYAVPSLPVVPLSASLPLDLLLSSRPSPALLHSQRAQGFLPTASTDHMKISVLEIPYLKPLTDSERSMEQLVARMAARQSALVANLPLLAGTERAKLTLNPMNAMNPMNS